MATPSENTVFSPASLAAEQAEPAIIKASSLALDWRAALLKIYRGDGESPEFETPVTEDVKVVVNLEGESELRGLKRGLWRTGIKRAGSLGITAAGDTSRLKWRSLTPGGFIQAHLHFSTNFLEEGLEERRRAGLPTPRYRLGTLAADDTIVAAIVGELVSGLRIGATDLFAEERVRLLATHLTVAAEEWENEDGRSPGVMGEGRLRRALEFMSADLAANHSLEEIARQAGISLYHFARMFREATGLPPHAYLTKLRLDVARSMLERSDVPVAEVARFVGYPMARNFNAAFSRRFGSSPGSWRRDHRSSFGWTPFT